MQSYIGVRSDKYSLYHKLRSNLCSLGIIWKTCTQNAKTQKNFDFKKYFLEKLFFTKVKKEKF